MNELNLGICDYAITQFYRLFYGDLKDKKLAGDAAYQFDKAFIEYEQGVVAPPIYGKTSASTIKKFQDMADKDVKGNNGGAAWAGSIIFDVVPAFDDFDPPAKVTDNQFRIDLPLLMLYLDKHIPTWSGFKNKNGSF